MSGSNLKLPSSVVTKQQFVRFVTEFEAASADIDTEKIRGVATKKRRPKVVTTERVEQFLEENSVKSTDDVARLKLLRTLRRLRKTAPVVHLTFASEADEVSLMKMSEWLRQNVDPAILIEVGLQPGLVAGVYVRAKNQVFDYSLKSRLRRQRESLVNALRTTK